MRILVISDLPHFVTGGAEMQAMRLIGAWLDQGHQVICLGRRMGRGPVRIGPHTVEVKRIRCSSLFGRWSRALTYALSLTWLLLRLRKRIDVVYTRFLGEAAATTALLKQAGLLSIPLVSTPANTYGQGDTHLLQSLPYSSHLIRLLDRQCDAINLIAEGMTVELRAAGFSGHNFTHIPNGIQIGVLPPHLPNTPIRCIAVGRLSPQKGYDVLLRAIAQVREFIHPGQFVVIGDGPERDRLQTLAADLKLTPYVIWRGELEQKDVAHELCRANLYLLPSLYEGMSNAGLEAMERALPVILTRCGGLDRHIDENMGWLASPGDTYSLAEALLAALSTSPEVLATMGVRCRRKVEDDFDIKTTSSNYIALFEKLSSRNLPITDRSS